MKFLKTIIFVILLVLAAFGLYSIYSKYSSFGERIVVQNSEVLLEKIHTVMKLVTVEGDFSEIYDYKDYVIADAWPFRKSAIIKVSATVLVGYDLEDLKVDIDEENRIIKIQNFPETEIISIEHHLEYYDMKQGLFNVITIEDVTEMSDQAKKFIEEKARNSELFGRVDQQKEEIEKMLGFIFQNTGWKFVIGEDSLLN